MSPELETEETASENKSVDFFAARTIVLTDEVNTRNAETNAVEKKEVEFVHRTIPLENKHWLEFNDILNPRRKIEGRKVIYADNFNDAVNAIYKKLVPEVPEGYAAYFRQGLTVENFHDLIPFKDKEKVLDRVFAFQISEAAEEEFFFDDGGETIFEIDVPISDAPAIGRIALRQKLKADEKQYKKATEPDSRNFKRFRNPEISIKPDYKKLIELFASLKTAVGVFENDDVPVWIGVGLMTFYFTEYGTRDAKN